MCKLANVQMEDSDILFYICTFLHFVIGTLANQLIFFATNIILGEFFTSYPPKL